ncbi:MAG: glycerate kinase [Clostridium sp.]|nr:glycerate kinase [Clostridium sp.]
MHILIAPDSYKGSLTARRVCDILAQALLTHPGVTAATLPLSDGGEGFGTCCVDACKGDTLYTNAVDLYGNTIQAPLYTWDDTALIECAANLRFTDEKGHYGRLLLRRGYAAEKRHRPWFSPFYHRPWRQRYVRRRRRCVGRSWRGIL